MLPKSICGRHFLEAGGKEVRKLTERNSEQGIIFQTQKVLFQSMRSIHQLEQKTERLKQQAEKLEAREGKTIVCEEYLAGTSTRTTPSEAW